MSGTVKVKGITIGEGIPKVCVPMVGTTICQLNEEAHFLKTLDIDVVEWRADFFEKVEDLDQVTEALSGIRTILPDIPLLFTYRSAEEGGEREISKFLYFSLNKHVIQTGLVDFIDVELFKGEELVKESIEVAHQNNVLVVVSNHDFDETPSKEEIVSRLKKAQELGADLPKLAVMPKGPSDVLTLLDATYEMKKNYADRPIITMSMACDGVISRMSGEIFGSALTFASAKKASAPGQIHINDLRRVLDMIHEMK